MVRYRKPNGASTDKRGFATMAMAEAWKAENIVAVNQGLRIDPTRGRATVGSLTDSWLATKKETSSPSGHRSVESTWKLHVKPRRCDT